MCIAKDETVKPVLLIGYALREVNHYCGEVHISSMYTFGGINTKEQPMNVWLDSQDYSEVRRLEHFRGAPGYPCAPGDSYSCGWHVFHRAADAKRYRKSCRRPGLSLFKLAVKGHLASGRCDIEPYGKVSVFRWIKLLEELPE